MEVVMSRTLAGRLLGLAMTLLLAAACAAYRAQHQAAAAPAPEAHEASPVAVNPSGEFSELRPDLQIARVKGEAAAVKASLAEQGRYSCCVDPSCTQCLLKYGECHCREAVRKEGPSCGECTEAWIEGKGIVEGVNAWDILVRERKKLEEANRQGSGEEKPPAQEPQHHHAP
jgi:hypothetical protein